MIHIDAITVANETKLILKDFSLVVDGGEKIVISGESGSGKSTLLKTLIGMYLPLKGSIAIAGMALTPQNLQAIRKRIYYLPQDIIPHGEESVLEYLQYPFTFVVNKGLSFSKDRVKELLEYLNLKKEILRQPLFKLSGGERKRVGLIPGLLMGRTILLLDEPTAGVDAGNRDVIIKLLCAADNATIIAVSHDAELIAKSDTTVTLNSCSLTEVTT